MARDSCGLSAAIIAVWAMNICSAANDAPAGSACAVTEPRSWVRVLSASRTRMSPPSPSGVAATATGVYGRFSAGGMAELASTTVLMPSTAARVSSIG